MGKTKPGNVPLLEGKSISAATVKNPVTVVGLGASAGGLEALSRLVAKLDPTLPFAFVVLQHVSPKHRSLMSEILGRETRLRVLDLKDGTHPEPGTIYVVPSNTNAIIRNGVLRLISARPEISPKPSINEFFISLAADAGEAAVGVILSGTGSDGTAGLRAIQAAGGVSLVQEPSSAKYDGMPQSAIEAGVADYVLSPEDIAAEVGRVAILPSPEEEGTLAPELLDKLLRKLHDHRGIDFGNYKPGTLSRRIRRRIMATGNASLIEYLDWIERHPGELDLLTKDILISVTAFFRDPESFRALEKVVREICRDREPEHEIRVWIAGCATGEEAYSIGILFQEAMRDLGKEIPLHVFATDIDQAALNVGRRGWYPAASLSGIPQDLIQRYFHATGGGFEVGRKLRDATVFARHNLVDDPPFLRLDLVTCRNVLIYFDSPLQSRVLQRFHFSLKKGGRLFLGRSENVSQADVLFADENRKERIFLKKGQSTHFSSSQTLPFYANITSRTEEPKEILQVLTAYLGVSAVLCDGANNVIHIAGDVSRFLSFPQGKTNVAIFEMIAKPFRAEIRSLLHQFEKASGPFHGQPHKLADGWWSLSVLPLSSREAGRKLVIFSSADGRKFKSKATRTSETDSSGPAIKDELAATREHLQSIVEELALANEEMQSLNEEAQASNEELQATNEELEAANEELQASNEELVSLNEELNVKTAELGVLNEEYADVYNSLNFPVLVFDTGFLLRRFNVSAAREFELKASSIGRSFPSLKLPSEIRGLEKMLHHAAAHAERQEHLLTSHEQTTRLLVTPALDDTGHVRMVVATLMDVTDLAKARDELKDSTERLQAVMSGTSLVLAMKDFSGKYLYANPEFTRAFGLPPEVWRGKTDFDIFPESFARSVWSADLRAMGLGGSLVAEHGLASNPGRLFRAKHRLVQGAGSSPGFLISEFSEITDLKSTEEQIQIAAKVYEHAGEAIVVVDAEGRIRSINAAFTTITGLSGVETYKTPLQSLFPDFLSGIGTWEVLWGRIQSKGFWQGELELLRPNGELVPLWVTVSLIDKSNTEKSVFVVMFSDISNLKETQRKADYLATHDPLTGLPNRSSFQEQLALAMDQVRSLGAPLTLIFLDLDSFKEINDTLGHDAGDQLLIEVAGRLKGGVRSGEFVARFGGDEFTLVLPGLSPEQAELMASRILSRMAKPFTIQGRNLFVSASLGLAFAPQDAANQAELIRAADTAMYRAKERGKNRFEIFRPELQVRLIRQLALESGLREAIDRGRFRLVFQPKYFSSNRKLAGAEALLRWNDPSLGEVSPGEFIPVAEATGLILSVDRQVSLMVVRQASVWLQAGLQSFPIAFNISARTFQDESFVDQLLEDLRRHAVSSEFIQVEITEGTLLTRSATELGNIEKLREAGIRLAIDDFGTGYSSLSYLKRLPIAELKIDRSFVAGLGDNASDEAITKAILGVAEALSLPTVGEGVENDQQLEWLKQHGCQIIQGFLLSKPLELKDFESILKESSR